MIDMLLFSSNKENQADKLVRKIVYRLGLKESLTVCDDIAEMESFLRKPRGKALLCVAILIADNQQDLAGLMRVRPLLKGAQIIFVLPDWEQHSVDAGHCFYPRYITSMESNIADVEQVLRKMLPQDVSAEH